MFNQYQNLPAQIEAVSEEWLRVWNIPLHSKGRQLKEYVKQFFETRAGVFLVEDSPVVKAVLPVPANFYYAAEDKMGGIYKVAADIMPSPGNEFYDLVYIKHDGQLGLLWVGSTKKTAIVTPEVMVGIIQNIENNIEAEIDEKDFSIYGEDYIYIDRPDVFFARNSRLKSLFEVPNLAYGPEFKENHNAAFALAISKSRAAQEITASDHLHSSVLNLMERIQEQLGQAVDASYQEFQGLLNPELMTTLRSAGGLALKAYNFLALEDGFSKRRKDLAATFPFMIGNLDLSVSVNSPSVIINPRLKQDEEKPPVRLSHVDYAIYGSGVSINELLVEAYAVPMPLIKRFVSVPHEILNLADKFFGTGQNAEAKFKTLIEIVSLFDLNKVPYYRKDPVEFEALLKIILAADRFAQKMNGYNILGEREAPEIQGGFRRRRQINLAANFEDDQQAKMTAYSQAIVASLINATKGKASLICDAYGGTADNMATSGYNVHDMIDAIIVSLVFPEVYNRDRAIWSNLMFAEAYTNAIFEAARPLVLYELFLSTSPGIGRLLETSMRWHAQQYALNDRIHTWIDPDEWLKLIPTTEVPATIASEGLKIVSLNTAKLLNEEGQRMTHCVGGYAYLCKTEPTHILSIRNIHDDKSISTLQLNEKNGGFDEANNRQIKHVEIAQHRGYHNHSTPKDAMAAAKWLVEQINTGAITIDFEAINKRRRMLGQKTQSVKEICGFDPRSEQERENAFVRHREIEIIPQRFTSLAQLLNSENISEAVDRAFKAVREAAGREAQLGR